MHFTKHNILTHVETSSILMFCHRRRSYATPMDKVSGNDSYSSSNYSKRIHSTDSLATTTNTCKYSSPHFTIARNRKSILIHLIFFSFIFDAADSTYDVATEPPTLPMSHKNFPKSNTARQLVTPAGAYLKLNSAYIALSIPELAIGKNQKHSMFLSVLNEDSVRVCIPDVCTHISPIVHCGPVDVTINKPVVLRVPHCAEQLDQWRISLYYSNAHIQELEPKWRKVVTLGEETINTPAYVQMDEKYAYIMTEFLGRFALIGESLSNGMGAVKRLKLFLFGPSVQPNSDCNIRVYVVEDFPSSKDYCASLETRLGGTFLGQSAPLTFQDNGQDLNLSLKCIGSWRSKTGAESQKIPFSHVWNSSLALHCAFALQRIEHDATMTTPPGLKLEVTARQRQGGEVIATHVAPFLPIVDTGLSVIDEYSDNSLRSVTVSEKGVTSCIQADNETVAFKLTRQAKRELCACLDPPTSRGNDWRMLAHRLKVDRYIAFFATKPSPTEQILDLWECKCRESNALAELSGTLRSMGRNDAVEILEKTLGPLWL